MFATRWGRIALILTCLLAAVPARSVLAQDADVLIEPPDIFGVGGQYRPGEITGIRLQVSPAPGSGLGEATGAWIQWEVPNADGDIAEYGRPVMLQPSQPRRVWLYAPLPPDTDTSSTWPVRVFAYEDGRRGRELGAMRIGPSGIGVFAVESMVGVIASTQMGLNQLALQNRGAGGDVFSAHENTRPAFNIRPDELPDRWEGLKGLDVLVWGDRPPQDLGDVRARAIREWVRRGGHLVISLPEDTNPWGFGDAGRTPLDDLLPSVAPRKDDEVSLTEVLPVLSKTRRLIVAEVPSVSIHVFAEIGGSFDTLDERYDPLIALPDGRVVAVQRLFGHGRITLLGLDLANRVYTDQRPYPNGLIASPLNGDVLWNRILGRRADTPIAGELGQLDQTERLNRGTPTEVTVADGPLFRQAINMAGAAGAGLAMATGLFLVYWLVAGPGGFLILKRYRLVRHAWLAFAGASAVFTALAWSGVQGLRQNEVRVQHLTFLDHIARPPTGASTPWDDVVDPQLHRAVSWLSVYMPGYGDTRVSIESAPAEGAVPAQRDLLLSFTPPRDTIQSFPNADRYQVDVSRAPASVLMPSRSTATQLYANTLGAVDTEWGGRLHSDPDAPITVVGDTLSGSIRNGLPGDLTDVTLIWIWNQRLVPRRFARLGEQEQPWIDVVQSGQMLNVGRMWRVQGGLIEQGGAVTIPTFTGKESLKQNITDLYVKEFEGRALLQTSATTGVLADPDWRQRLEMLMLYGQLDPPRYLKREGQQNPDTMMAQRHLGRELDLSPWFNRPCLIVIGYLRDSACPIRLRVDGEPVASSGTTVVRWIHPLPVDERIAFDGARPTAEAR